MILIVGLGNPGEKYQNTRHNLGFMVVEALARKFLSLEEVKWQEEKKFNCLILRIPPNILLIKPQTFMNASGIAVKKLADFYKVAPENIWVIHDDVDLPLGRIKIKPGGGTAGHRGVESIVNYLATEKFPRFRLGIGHPTRSNEKLVEKYVLQNFEGKEWAKVRRMIKKVSRAITVAIKEGLEKAMNQFNG